MGVAGLLFEVHIPDGFPAFVYMSMLQGQLKKSKDTLHNLNAVDSWR